MDDMYLSLLSLSVRARLVNRIKNDYTIHQLVYRLFPNEQERKFLYRVDFDNLGNMEIMIQSSIRPEDIGIGNLRVKKIPAGFFMQDRYYFRLRFAPVVKLDGKVIRVESRTADAISWLCSRAARLGVVFEDNTLDKAASSTYRMFPGKDRRAITISSVDITGILKVTDRDMFFAAVKRGIGPYKGFGLGLLQLRPIKEEKEE